MIYTPELIKEVAPSIFATSYSDKLSNKYAFVPTDQVIEFFDRERVKKSKEDNIKVYDIGSTMFEDVQNSDLLIGDKNAILVASRVLAYGPIYNVSVNDPKENESVDVEVDMAKLSTKEVDESLFNRENEYDFVLPKSKTPIKFKLLTHGDEILIQKDIDASEKTLKQGNEITTRWRRIIIEVNGNRDLGYISNFVVNQFQIQDSKALRNHIKDMTPDVDFTFEYTSPFTGDKEALRVPIGVDFFYPTE